MAMAPRMASILISSWVKNTFALSRSPRLLSTSSFVIRPQAPGFITIWFCPVTSSTMITAVPVGVSSEKMISPVSMPSPLYSSSATCPNISFPILVTNLTFPPALWAATAWLDPFPPGPIINPVPSRVSPARGRPLDRLVRSAAKLPNTTMPISLPPVLSLPTVYSIFPLLNSPRPFHFTGNMIYCTYPVS